MIADDLARNGQDVPTRITGDGTIVDGERRWRGARSLGWELVDVVVVANLSDDELLDRVIDCCTSATRSLRDSGRRFDAIVVDPAELPGDLAVVIESLRPGR